MPLSITKTTLGVIWLVALALALWAALQTGFLPVWAAVVFIAVMPAVMVMVMANAPAKSMAEIIRDVERGPLR
jgi:hypothetical protein